MRRTFLCLSFLPFNRWQALVHAGGLFFLSISSVFCHQMSLSVSLSVFEQVSLSSGTKKLVAVAAFSAVSVLFLARRFRRRKGKKKVVQEQKTSDFLSTLPPLKGSISFVSLLHFHIIYNIPNHAWCPYLSSMKIYTTEDDSLVSEMLIVTSTPWILGYNDSPSCINSACYTGSNK